jgi:hypothetical protein
MDTTRDCEMVITTSKNLPSLETSLKNHIGRTSSNSGGPGRNSTCDIIVTGRAKASLSNSSRAKFKRRLDERLQILDKAIQKSRRRRSLPRGMEFSSFVTSAPSSSVSSSLSPKTIPSSNDDVFSFGITTCTPAVDDDVPAFIPKDMPQPMHNHNCLSRMIESSIATIQGQCRYDHHHITNQQQPQRQKQTCCSVSIKNDCYLSTTSLARNDSVQKQHEDPFETKRRSRRRHAFILPMTDSLGEISDMEDNDDDDDGGGGGVGGENDHVDLGDDRALKKKKNDDSFDDRARHLCDGDGDVAAAATTSSSGIEGRSINSSSLTEITHPAATDLNEDNAAISSSNAATVSEEFTLPPTINIGMHDDPMNTSAVLLDGLSLHTRSES